MSLLCFYPLFHSPSCLPANVVDIYLWLFFKIWPSRSRLPYRITAVLKDSFSYDQVRWAQTLLRSLMFMCACVCVSVYACAWFHTTESCLCNSDCAFASLCVFSSMNHQVWAWSAAGWGPLSTVFRRAWSTWWDSSSLTPGLTSHFY